MLFTNFRFRWPVVRLAVRRLATVKDGQHIHEPSIPQYSPRTNETSKDRRARLLYQSRKRGMTENGIILSTFFAKYGNDMTEEQLSAYDRLINEPSNDWVIYNWVVKRDEVPDEYQGDIMTMLQEHAANTAKEQRYKQPDL